MLARKSFVGALVALVIGVGLAPSAAHATVPAELRVAHLSPDTPSMDVYLTPFDGSEKLVLPALSFGQVSEYMPLNPGTYQFGFRPAGTPSVQPPVVIFSATVAEGGDYTFAVLGQIANLKTTLVKDDNSAPAAGSANVRLIQADSTTPEVSVQVENGPLLADKVAFGTVTGYATVPAGTWTIDLITPAGTTTKQTLQLDSGSVNSLVVLTGANGPTMSVLTDAEGMVIPAPAAAPAGAPAVVAATQVMPVGGIQTGGGSTASAYVDQGWAGTGPVVMLGLVFGPARPVVRAVRRTSATGPRSIVTVLAGWEPSPWRPLAAMSGCARSSVVTVGEAPATAPSTSHPPTSAAVTPATTVADDATPGPGALLPVPAMPRPRPVGVGAADPSSAPPVEIDIPAIGVVSTLEDLHLLPDGTIAAPVDYARAGWFADGVLPGAPGPAIIAGHVDSQKRGGEVFYRLDELQPDDLVVVKRSDGTAVTYRVTNVEQYKKDDFPVALVYGPTPGPSLRLVTCGGQFDRNAGHYRSNTVVFAVLAA
jgi:hypothetical protein